MGHERAAAPSHGYRHSRIQRGITPAFTSWLDISFVTDRGYHSKCVHCLTQKKGYVGNNGCFSMDNAPGSWALGAYRAVHRPFYGYGRMIDG
jgi:hypothetical protein